MSNIIQSANFITEASDLSGKLLGVSIEPNEFITENFNILASLMQGDHAKHALNEYSRILAMLVKRETIARMQKSIDNISASNF